MSKIVELSNISKKFDNNYIIKDINCSIEENTIVGIVGRNGSGKTVLLKIIAGLYIPTTGNVYFNDGLSKKEMGILIDTGFLPNKTGLQNLELIASLNNKVSKSECFHLMNLVGLDPFSKLKYKNYSMGMKQRLALAQSIMENPRFIILDEPFNGIDNDTVKEFRTLISNLKRNGKTIIITSHYQEDITLLCDKVYKMDKGKLEEIS